MDKLKIYLRVYEAGKVRFQEVDAMGVVFTDGPPETVLGFEVRANPHGRGLEIRARDGEMLVRPHAANVIRVEELPWGERGES